MKTAIVAVSANVEYLPLALLNLKSSLLNKISEPPHLLNFNFEDSPDEMAKKILSFNFDIVGFSVYVWNIKIVKEIAKIIKGAKPQTKIVLGGPEVSPKGKEVMEEFPEADYIVIDEGEFTFRDLLLSLSGRGGKISEIKGLFYRENGKIVATEQSKKIEPLDLIPFAYCDKDFEVENNFKVLPVETMRGCRYKCRFCFYSKGKNKIRFFSDERVKESLFYALKKSSCKKIYLMDPDFTSNRERAKKICSFIFENNEEKKPFHTEIRAEEVDEEMASFLSKANITDVEVGVQSTNKDVLKMSGRASKLEFVKRGIENLNKYGIKSELQLILGLPLETKESFLKSIDDAVEMSPTTLACFRLLVLPGTYFNEFSESLGLVYEQSPPWRIISNGRIDENEIITLSRCGIYASYMYSNFKLTTKYLLKELKMSHSQISYLFAQEERSYEVDEPITSNKHKRIIASHIPYLFEKLCKDKGLNFNFYKAIMTKEMAFKE